MANFTIILLSIANLTIKTQYDKLNNKIAEYGKLNNKIAVWGTLK